MSTLQNFVPIPLQDAIAQPKRIKFKAGEKDPMEGMLTGAWLDYFTNQSKLLEQVPARIQTVALTAQAASVAAFDITDGALSPGLYQVTWYARITTAAGINSSLTVTVDWTDGGVSPSFSGAAMTGNTTTTVQSETFMINIDANSPIRLATTYASAGAPAMDYAVYLVLNEVQA